METTKLGKTSQKGFDALLFELLFRRIQIEVNGTGVIKTLFSHGHVSRRDEREETKCSVPPTSSQWALTGGDLTRITV